MAQVTLNGDPVTTSGELPKIGDTAPDYLLTRTDLTDVGMKDFAGKKIVLNIFPSIDTPVCAMSVRKFNEEIAKIDNAVVLCISMDLPFAHKRFCETEGIKNAISVSELRERSFGEAYGVRIIDGPLRGLLTRSVVVIGSDGKIVFAALVPEIKNEPDYNAVLNVLQSK